MITYNHEPFIAQAIDGVLMQKTNFQIELVIGEDCSIDRTREICIAYQTKYPEIIKLKLPEKNLGMMPNFIQTLGYCTGKYIALCEGDDYWTDPLKLQKQVDFLEENSEYSGCFHDTIVIIDEKESAWRVYDKEDFSILDTFSTSALFHTSSLVFRRNALNLPLPKWMSKVVSGDMAIFSLVANRGKLRRICGFMSVYRKHLGGVTQSTKVVNNFHKNRIELMGFLNKEFDYKYKNEINQVIAFHQKNINNQKYIIKLSRYLLSLKRRINKFIDG